MTIGYRTTENLNGSGGAARHAGDSLLLLDRGVSRHQQARIDAAIQTYYEDLFDEDTRLTTRSAQGRLEFERTQEIVRAATPAPARLLDVGGATGIHAAALARDGYEVTLIDPVPGQVATARKYGTFEALVGDARTLDLTDGSFDAVLMAGPLYHLAARRDRVRALSEGRRVCRADGFVHAAAIPRMSAIAVAVLDWDVLNPAPEAVMDLIRHGDPAAGRFPAGHFHTAEELHEELTDAGLRNVTVVGLEGPAGMALETVDDVSQEDFSAAKRLAFMFQSSPQIRDYSCHLLGTGQV